MSEPALPRPSPTVEQWKLIEASLPEAHALALALARQASRLSSAEIKALVEDGLIRRVVDFDSSRGTTLVQYARTFLVRDILRAAYKRANDPMVLAALQAADVHAGSAAEPDLAVQFAESLDEKAARLHALGADTVAAAYFAQERERVMQTHEDELIARDRWKELERAAEGAGEHAGALVDLLYVKNLTWNEAAAKLGMSVPTAKRLEERIIERLRGFLRRERSGASLRPQPANSA